MSLWLLQATVLTYKVLKESDEHTTSFRIIGFRVKDRNDNFRLKNKNF